MPHSIFCTQRWRLHSQHTATTLHPSSSSSLGKGSRHPSVCAEANETFSRRTQREGHVPSYKMVSNALSCLALMSGRRSARGNLVRLLQLRAPPALAARRAWPAPPQTARRAGEDRPSCWCTQNDTCRGQRQNVKGIDG